MRFVLPLLLCLGACGGAQAAPVTAAPVTAAPVTAAPPSALALPDADPGAPTEALLALWESDEDPARCPALLQRLAEAPPEGAARLARAGRAALACEAPARARALLAASLREEDACLPRVQLAAALRALGNAPAAEAQLRATRRAHPRCVEAPLAQARLLGELDRGADATAAARDALALATGAERARAFDALTRAHLAAGEPELAALACRQALHVDPRRAASWHGCGLADLARGRLPEGLQSLERARELDPGLIDAWLRHGQVALAHRDYEEAERLSRGALAQDPASYDALVVRGIALRALGRADEARASYLRAIEVAPDRPEAWFDLAVLLQEEPRDRRDLDEAARALRTFLDLVEGDPAYAHGAVRARDRLDALGQSTN